MTARACLGCGDLTTAGSRCSDCAVRHRLGWDWSATRDAWLASHPTCVSCGALAAEVDHVIPRSRGGKDDGNLQSLCRDCHVAKTTREGQS
jgi:5-methylcytosine-specific restriction endonuclease McrA